MIHLQCHFLTVFYSVRLTASQIAMSLLLGEILPFVGESAQDLKGRVNSGYLELVSITGADFGFDPQSWNDYLIENCAEYRWNNKHLRINKLMKKVLNSREWQQAVQELRCSSE